MATSATTERKAPARRSAPKAEHLSMQYPELTSSDHPHFWVAAYLRDLANYVALHHLNLKLRKLDKVTAYALFSSEQRLTDEVNNSLRSARKDGLLLYAWPGTKLFTNPEARH
ncbi:hypothetical protein [Comamonas sp. A7-5]|uniref:hypothetical protein n=1 Tax=Comamonas sp. A7-5 TaxID=673549 RepID=UPI0031CE7D55